MSEVRGFPFGSLPHIARHDLAAQHALRQRLLGWFDRERAEHSLHELTSQRIEVQPRGVRLRPAQIGTPGDVGVLLLGLDDDPSDAVLLELEGGLAASLVGAALRGGVPRVIDAQQLPSPRVIGALAAVLMAWARRAVTAPLRVQGAGSAHALARELYRQRQGLICWQLGVQLGDSMWTARITTPAGPPSRPPPAAAKLAQLGPLPLHVPVVLCAVPCDAEALVALGVGDVLLLGEPPLTDAAREVIVCAAHSEHGVRAEWQAGALRYMGEPHALRWSPTEPEDLSDSPAQEQEMSEEFEQSLTELPVTVRVEVGHVTLSARQWAELSVGDTLALGQRLGAPITLRVAGREVARGELVQIDGELGVRLRERIG